MADTSQQIAFCRSEGGVRIAYATHGSGPPLLVNSCWLSNLQHDWKSPVWRHFLVDLGKITTMIRYDERGFGQSDWEVSDFSLEARIADLENVVESARVDRFALLGMAQGGQVAIAYAHRHPERVTRLILYGTYAAALRSPKEQELFDTFSQMIRVGWARPDAVFRRVFTNMMIPGATEAQMQWIDELQRVSTSAEILVEGREQRAKADVTDLLPELDVPTIVLHSRGDQMNDFEDATLLAAAIPHARLVALESANHIVLADEPAWATFVEQVSAFLEPDRRAAGAGPAVAGEPLSSREIEVLRLVARGMGNSAIAARLTLSVRTVERHLSNTYLKLGLSGKGARAGAVAHLLLR